MVSVLNIFMFLFITYLIYKITKYMKYYTIQHKASKNTVFLDLPNLGDYRFALDSPLFCKSVSLLPTFLVIWSLDC